MSDRSQPDTCAAAGFTLLELLLVLAVLALIAAVGLPALSSPADGVRLRAAADELAASLRIARVTAIARNREVAVVIDADKRRIEADGLPLRRLDPDIAMKLTIAEPERAAPSRGGFRFFADGSSTGGDVVLRLRDREVRLCVDWLTGRPQQGGAC